MIDIHTHILPNIDDGADSIETSIAMIEQEIKDGVETIVLTPHFIYNHPYTKDELSKKYSLFKKQISHLPIKTILGSEVYYHANKIETFRQFTFENTKVILIEFSLHNEIDMEEAVHELIVSGFTVIVAHPERYTYIKWQHIINLKNSGVFFQVNSLSILGNEGIKIKKFVMQMFKYKMVDFVASDAHNMDKRKPNLGKCYDFVVNFFGVNTAKAVFNDNAKRILIL